MTEGVVALSAGYPHFLCWSFSCVYIIDATTFLFSNFHDFATGFKIKDTYYEYSRTLHFSIRKKYFKKSSYCRKGLASNDLAVIPTRSKRLAQLHSNHRSRQSRTRPLCALIAHAQRAKAFDFRIFRRACTVTCLRRLWVGNRVIGNEIVRLVTNFAPIVF